MTDQTATAAAGTLPVPSARLEPDAISVAQDTLIGLADTGPTVSVSFTLVALIAATAYAAPTVLLITAVPMLIIANAYRRLNLWNANCGASFEWVGRASYRVLPQFLANVSRRFATPVAASIIVGLLIIGLSSVYFLATTLQNAFTDVVD